MGKDLKYINKLLNDVINESNEIEVEVVTDDVDVKIRDLQHNATLLNNVENDNKIRIKIV